VYIIDKKEDGGHLFEGPARLSTSGTNVFKPIAPVDLWATDAAFSPDGTQLAVRGYLGGILYDWNGGKIKREAQLHVPFQGQGESVTYSADGKKLMYGAEGADSPVQAQDAPGSSGDGGDGKASKSPSDGTGAQASNGGDGPFGGLKTGVVAVAVAVVALLGLGRLVRRRS
jgi:WD40 repeat protein